MNYKHILSISIILALFSLNTFSTTINNNETNAPDLVYSGHILDDDDNGSSNGNNNDQVEGGETIEMTVGAVNTGDEIAHNVIATIVCTDGDINITDDTEVIGDIINGTSGWTMNDFDFEIVDNCPEKDVTFTVTFTSDEGVWTANFVIHIYPSASPVELVYSTHIIDDDIDGGSDGDGDGNPEGGESIELPLAIINNGGVTAHNVQGTLSCSDPDISIIDASEGFGSVAPGAIDWTNNDFDFDVSPTCPEKDVVFTIEITADEGVWSNDFIIHVFAAGLPEIAYHNHLLDDDDNGSSNGDGDGNAESGEEIELSLSVINTGEAIANNVVAVLSCTDADIIITDNSESFGDIIVGQEAWSNYSYDFEINPNAPDKDVIFNLAITSDEGSWNSSFTISITHPGSPILEYANHTIDDDGDGSSNGDGDGIPEAGEIIELPIQIHNVGIISATSVSAIISTTDTDINITDAFEYYPDITPGNNAWCNNDFDIEVAADCPEKDVTFTIEIEADEGNWSDSFIIHISEQGTPILNFSSLIIDDDMEGNSSGNNDGVVQPGEQIELPIAIINNGDANANNVSAVLSTNDSHIYINDANENFGAIAAGTTEWSNNEFDLTVDADCPDKDVLFTLTMTSEEGVWTSNFIIHVTISGNPICAYTSHIIDDDIDGNSQGDGDGDAEAGEEIELPLAISNVGTAVAHNVIGVISCTDTDITITDDTENFGNILVGEEEWSNSDFDFEINYGAPEKDVIFTIEIQSDEDVWSDTFAIHIYPASGAPDITYLSHLIDDDDNGSSNGDGDGNPSAGEEIELPIQIENNGTATAHNISAVLSCTDSDIIITDAEESYSDLNVGETSWSNSDFDFEISSTCPDKTVTFSLLITADEGSWTSTFNMVIIGAGTPHLILSNYLLDDDDDGGSDGDSDGLAEPGETIELPIEISNIGDGPVHNVEGELSTNDPDIFITDEFESFGDITEGSQVWCANDFDFEISETCPEKDVLFTLSLEGDEGSWSTTISIHITPLTYFEVITSANPTSGGITEGDGTYTENEYCTINAEANDGHTFLHWTKNGIVMSEEEEYTFIVTENADLEAYFQIHEFEIIVNAFPTTGGTVNGGGVYQYNETASVSAFPNPDYVFVEWKVDGETVSTDETYSFLVTESSEITAHFQGELYIIEATANPSNGGSISGDGEYQFGEIAILTATPASNYNFINWTENGTVVSTDAIYSFEVSSNRVLEAHFSEDFFTIDAFAVPTNGGPIEGTGIYTAGQSATVSTTPNGGYYFIDWKENGNTVSTNFNYTFTVSEDRFLEAHFGVFDYEITVLASPIEAGEVSGGGNYNYGDEVIAIATAYSGWEFLSWTNNGIVVSNNAEYSFNITENMNLQANFIVQEFTITAYVDPNNGGSVIGDGIYEYGETATLTAHSSNGYDFIHWSENNDVVSEDVEYHFIVTSDRELMAVFDVVDGIHQLAKNTIQIYPNPTGGLFFIDLSSNTLAVIYNSRGELIKEINLMKGKQEIDISTLADGLYFVKFTSKEKSEILKIVKE